MKLYVDEDTAERLLVKLLRNAGHDVVIPADIALSGESDAVQLTQAIRDSRACLTKNCDDFQELHDLVLQSGGNHFGVLVIRQVNDPTHDLSPKGVVTAIRKLETANVPIANQFIELNHWRQRRLTCSPHPPYRIRRLPP